MNLLHDPGDSCILYAVAMLLNETPAQLIAEIGHNGQEILWPEAMGSFQKRGFHIDELNSCFMRRGMILATIECLPQIAPNPKFVLASASPKPVEVYPDIEKHCADLRNLIARGPCILVGNTHAVACDGKMVYDSRDGIYPVEDTKMGIERILVATKWIPIESESK